MERIMLPLHVQAVARAPLTPLGATLTQGDVHAYRLCIRVFDGAEEFHYASVTSAKIIFARPDGGRVQGSAVLREDGFHYDVGTTELEAPGAVVGALQLWEGSACRLTTSMFSFCVTADPLGIAAEESASIVPELEALKRQLEEAVKLVKGWVDDPELLRGPEGPAGPEGKSGTGLTILGRYPSLDALTNAHPAGPSGGAWSVGDEGDSSVYVWDVDCGAWITIGKLEGPRGAKGEDGQPGSAGAQGSQGPAGERGAPAIVNGKSGDSIVLSDADIPYTGVESQADTLRAAADEALALAKQAFARGNEVRAGLIAVVGDMGPDASFEDVTGAIEDAKGILAQGLAARGVEADAGEALGTLAARMAHLGLTAFSYSGAYEEYEDATYRYIKLMSSGDLIFRGEKTVDVFLVGGGGGATGGGGGGGYTKVFAGVVARGGAPVPVIVGAGGAGADDAEAASGGYSEFLSSAYRAPGGKGGKKATQWWISAGDGGSGGGAGSSSAYNAGNGGSDGAGGSTGTTADGQTAGSGQGVTTRAFAEASGELYAGGGGGSTGPAKTPGKGGAGGGADGVAYGVAPHHGKPNTGGGGGGSGGGVAGGNGGSGIVIVRWPK